MAWLGDWAKRVKLTIDRNDIDAVLTWFPIRVYISTSSGRNSTDVSAVFDELTLDANRKKIAVTKADGVTQLYVEIEKWDDANEKANLWVSRDGWEIASGADTILYLYYDINKADNTSYVGDPNSTPAENVWDANFKLVDHMQDDPDNAHTRDSTDNNMDGTKLGGGEPAEAAAMIGDGQHGDGVDDEIAYDAGGVFLSLDEDFTIEMLVKFDNVTAHKGFWKMYETGNGVTKGYAYWNITGPYMYFRPYNAEGTLKNIAKIWSPSDETWYWITWTRVGNYYYMRINGTSIGGTTYTDTMYDDVGKIRMIIDGGSKFAAICDEIRISAGIARSAAWGKATYESAFDDLIAFGAEEIPTMTRTAHMAVKMVAGKLI